MYKLKRIKTIICLLISLKKCEPSHQKKSKRYSGKVDTTLKRGTGMSPSIFIPRSKNFLC